VTPRINTFWSLFKELIIKIYKLSLQKIYLLLTFTYVRWNNSEWVRTNQNHVLNTVLRLCGELGNTDIHKARTHASHTNMCAVVHLTLNQCHLLEFFLLWKKIGHSWALKLSKSCWIFVLYNYSFWQTTN
jgi:hypothetical protein